MPREPDAVEAAFRDELRRAGCPYCGSRKVIGRFRGVWSYTLACLPDCPSHADAGAAHKVAADAARAAGEATGEPLLYQAVDSGCGAVAGVVRGRQ